VLDRAVGVSVAACAVVHEKPGVQTELLLMWTRDLSRAFQGCPVIAYLTAKSP